MRRDSPLTIAGERKPRGPASSSTSHSPCDRLLGGGDSVPHQVEDKNVESSPLRQLANRASLAYASDPGFIGCEIESEDPPMLAYHFDTDIHAAEFQLRLQVLGIVTTIPYDRPTLVLHPPRL